MAGGLQGRDRTAVVRLSEAPKELARELRGEYARAARLGAAKTRTRILAADSHHAGGLRERIAGTVAVSLQQHGDRLQARIASLGSRMPAGEGNLPAYADGQSSRKWSRWRHPVFQTATHDVWVDQEWPSARGWFTGTLKGEQQRFADAARQAVDAVAAKIEGRR